MAEAGYVFNGIGTVEQQDRTNEHRTGVPALGGAAVLANAPVKRTAAVHVHNTGEEAAHLRLRHQGATKTRTNEYLVALAVGGNRYVGVLGNKAVVPGSVSITNAGAPPTIVDNGAGVLHDTGVPTAVRGTIDYAKGIVDFTYGAPPTEPVRVTYQHTDYTDFESPVQTTSKPAAAYPFTLQCGFGRVDPYSVALAHGGAETWVDDGKGNIIETTGGGAVKRGTIDYGSGLITLTAGPVLAGTVTATFRFNPFAAVLAKAGGAKLLDVFSQIPEFTGEAWADGIKGENRIGLWGESRSNVQTNLVTQWVHHGEEPYRVEVPFSGFPAGGESNNPNLIQSVAHL